MHRSAVVTPRQACAFEQQTFGLRYPRPNYYTDAAAGNSRSELPDSPLRVNLRGARENLGSATVTVNGKLRTSPTRHRQWSQGTERATNSSRHILGKFHSNFHSDESFTDP